MTTEPAKECINTIIAGLTESLAVYGFVGKPEIELSIGLRFVVWKQEFPWKLHVVRLTLEGRGPQLGALGLALQVRLRCGDPEELTLLDQLDVDALAHHRCEYKLPSLFDPLGFFCKRLLKTMVLGSGRHSAT
jgi:hypothetical protein